LYIASEYIEGRVLSAVMIEGRKKKKLTPAASAATWIRQLADALAYAHSQGIVHRDVKPDNILIDGQGQPLLMDFGLAKVLGDQSTLTTEGSLLGSPAYMSPEQARGDNQLVGPASDQYSLGVVLYELLTGEPPFEGPAHEVIPRILKEPPVPPREMNRRVPRDLEVICLKCLEKEAAHRYDSCRELADDLDAWLAGRPISARKTPLWERMARWTQNNRLIAGLAAGAAVLLVAITVASASFGLQLARHRREIDENLVTAREAQKREEEQARLESKNEAEAEKLFKQARDKKEEATRLAQEAAEARAKLEDEKRAIARATAWLETETEALARQKEALEAYRKDRAAKVAELDALEPWPRYVALVKMAQAAVDLREYSEARDLLGHCPEEHRGWEWNYLLGQTKEGVPPPARVSTGLPLVTANGPFLQESLAFSASAPVLAVLTSSKDLGDVGLTVLDYGDNVASANKAVLRGAILARLRGTLRAAAFSPSLDRIATMTADGVSVWNAKSGALQARRSSPGSTSIAQLAFTSDGRLIAVTGARLNSQKPVVWNGTTGKTLFSLDDEPLAIDSRAKWLACRKRAEGGSKSLVVLDLETGKPHASGWEALQKPGTSLDVEDCRFSSNGRWLVWKAVDQKKGSAVLVGLTDMQSSTAVSLNAQLLPFDISPAGDRFLTAAGVHAVEHGDILFTLPAPGIATVWSPDGESIAIVEANGGLRLLYARNNAPSLPDKPDGPDAADVADSAVDRPVEPTRGAQEPPKTEQPTPKSAASPTGAFKGDLDQEQALGGARAPVYITNSIGMRMSLLPAGKFRMGSPLVEKNRAEWEAEVDVTLTKSFFIGTTEVTRGEWQRVMRTTPWKEISNLPDGASYPAVKISWDDAVAFCQKLTESENASYRLPTSAEWEYACRAGTTTAYWFGDDEAQLVKFAWCHANTHAVGLGYPHEVARKPSNPFGLFDVHGNVWEWCADVYYTGNASGGTDPVVLGVSPNRTIRGGASTSEKHCRSAFFGGRHRSARGSDVGFRVVREATATEAAGRANLTVGGSAPVAEAPTSIDAATIRKTKDELASGPATNRKTQDQASANLLKPTNRTDSWRFEIFEGAKGTFAAVDDSIVFNVDTVTSTEWHIQAFQTDLHLKDGDQYTIRFSAKASQPRKVVLGAQIDEADWHSIGLSTPVPLTTSFQTFQVPFRVQNAGEKKCRIGFVLGASTGVVTIKNMTLTENTAAKN
jgi:formylglycine-generating enzyme required for sulfatase activity